MDKLADKLIRLYAQAEADIVRAIDRMTRAGNDPQKTIRQLQKQKKEIEAILASLRKSSQDWAKAAVSATYHSGVNLADEQLSSAGVKLKTNLGGIHRKAIEVFAEKTYSRMADVVTTAGRTAMDIYRTANLEAAMLGSVSGYESWRQAKKKILDEVTSQGIIGFVDRAGKKWSMRTYAEMLARTSLMEVHNEAQWREFRAHDEDLIEVSNHQGTCPKCAPWAGKILSLTGATAGYPTLAEAKEAGLFHPHCRHATALVVLLDQGKPKIQLPIITNPQRRAWAEKALESAPDEIRNIVKREAPSVVYTEGGPRGFARGKTGLNVGSSSLNDERHFLHTFFHELGHIADARTAKNGLHLSGEVGSSFGKAYATDRAKFMGRARKAKDEKLAAMRDVTQHGSKWYDDREVSDIVCSMSKGKIHGGWMHREPYYKTPGHGEAEVFANLFALKTQQKTEAIEVIRDLFPNVVQAFEDFLTQEGGV